MTGAEQSCSFGKILIKNSNVLKHVTIMNRLANFNLTNLVLMAGGDSSQMGLSGQTIVPSQDNRQVGDFIVLK
jgi:exopolysaccharide biosynthesis protein